MGIAAPTLPLGANVVAFRIVTQTNSNKHSAYLNVISRTPTINLNRIANFYFSAAQSNLNSNTNVATSCTYASGTITFSALANNDTVTVNGRVYTAKTSGAAGLQQFNIGGSDTNAATNFCAILNADTSVLVKGVVFGQSAGAVSTIFCQIPGNVGNICSLAISAHGSVSGALLTGGTETAVGNISLGL